MLVYVVGCTYGVLSVHRWFSEAVVKAAEELRSRPFVGELEPALEKLLNARDYEDLGDDNTWELESGNPGCQNYMHDMLWLDAEELQE